MVVAEGVGKDQEDFYNRYVVMLFSQLYTLPLLDMSFDPDRSKKSSPLFLVVVIERHPISLLVVPRIIAKSSPIDRKRISTLILWAP